MIYHRIIQSKFLLQSIKVFGGVHIKFMESNKKPRSFMDIKISGIDIKILIISGASPRGISMMMKTARVNAWLNNRTSVHPRGYSCYFP